MLFAFRQRVDPTQQFYVDRGIRDVPADRWEINNQSAAGYRLFRRQAGQRVMHKQLIAIRPPDHQHFLLAQAHWLMQDRSQSLVAGVEVLPGAPEAASVRVAVPQGENGARFEVAFLLPEVPAMNAETSLLVQNGVFQPGRILELHTSTIWRVRLTGLIQRGTDFERVSYVLAS